MKCILDNCAQHEIAFILKYESHITEIVVMNSIINNITINNNINKLIVTNCPNLKYINMSGISHLKYLKVYNCDNLSQIDINKIDNLYLSNIFFYNRMINSITIDCLHLNNIKNKTIFFSNALKIKTLKLIGNSILLKLIIPITILKALYIVNCKNLKILQFYKNVSFLQLKNLHKLITIKDPNYSNIVNMEITNCELLKYINIDYTKIVSFVINNSDNLQLLNTNMRFNNCKLLKLTNCKNLGNSFYINGNIKIIDIGNINAIKLIINCNLIAKKISINNCQLLEIIHLDSFIIEFIFLYSLYKMKHFVINCKLFAKMAIKQCSELQSITGTITGSIRNSLLSISNCHNLYQMDLKHNIDTLYHNTPLLMINPKQLIFKKNRCMSNLFIRSQIK